VWTWTGKLGGAHVTEFRRHEVTCARCGHRTQAAYDKKKIPSSPFGPQLTAVVAMLTGVYHLSRRSAQRLLRELFGVTISLGALSAMEARASEALASAAAEAHREVQEADVKHADATSWLRAGIVMSLWVLASATVTAYKILKDGRRSTIRSLFGALKGILVSDRATVFGFWAMKCRQVCMAHLIRKFVSFSERDGLAGELGNELLDCMALVFEYWHGFKDGTLTRDEVVAWMRPVQRHFEAVLQRAVAAKLSRLSAAHRGPQLVHPRASAGHPPAAPTPPTARRPAHRRVRRGLGRRRLVLHRKRAPAHRRRQRAPQVQPGPGFGRGLRAGGWLRSVPLSARNRLFVDWMKKHL